MSNDLFISHFEKIYQDRWPALHQALLIKEKQMLRKNKWLSGDAEHDPFVFEFQNPDQPYQPIRNGDENLLDVYIMDPGSYWAALALDVQDGHRVLDMCAAPGGKTLILAEALKTNGELISNELSASRRERLIKVIQQYVPRSVRDRVWVKGQDASLFGLKMPGYFDRILLDAPCSGERHILENPEELKKFTPRRTEHLASRQYALLASAWLALNPEGKILYSTCSISPEENDKVILKLIKKKKDVQLLTPWFVGDVRMSEWGIEKTECGYQFLPDRSGFGPLYFSLLSKNSR